jgi:hypothetical protein
LGSTATRTPQVAALSSTRRLRSDRAWRLIARFSPRFCATLTPRTVAGDGGGAEHLANAELLDRDQVVVADQAGEVCSAKSLRRSAARACNGAIAAFVRSRRPSPCAAVRSLETTESLLLALLSHGQCSSSPLPLLILDIALHQGPAARRRPSRRTTTATTTPASDAGLGTPHTRGPDAETDALARPHGFRLSPAARRTRTGFPFSRRAGCPSRRVRGGAETRGCGPPLVRCRGYLHVRLPDPPWIRHNGRAETRPCGAPLQRQSARAAIRMPDRTTIRTAVVPCGRRSVSAGCRRAARASYRAAAYPSLRSDGMTACRRSGGA